MGFLYFDTETTGLKPGQICQLSYIIEDNGLVTTAKNFYFEVSSMTEGAENTHHLSIDKLKLLSKGQKFSDRVTEILNDFSGNTLVGHNVDFDIGFISMEFWRCGIQFTPANKFDTMNYFNPIMKLPRKYRSKNGDGYKNPNLGELCKYFNIPDEKGLELAIKLFGSDGNNDITFHDSRFDIAMTFLVMLLHREDLASIDNKPWHNWLTA